MKFLKRFNEGVGIVKIGPEVSQERMPNLQHVGEPIENGDNISIFQQDWFEKLLPDTIKVHSRPLIKKLNFDQSLSNMNQEDRTYKLVKNDCTIDSDLVQFNYFQNTAENPGDEVKDGEPDLLEFDIHFVKNNSGIKLLVDITYGDNVVSEFSIESPNKINKIHYNGVGSKYDSKTHWSFTDQSISDLLKFFNSFNHGIKLNKSDLSFLDSDSNSYKHDINNPEHLYNDKSNLIEFENTVKESLNDGVFLIINNSKPPEMKYFPKVESYMIESGINYKVINTPEDLIKLKGTKILGALSTGSDWSLLDGDSPGSRLSEFSLGLLDCPILAMCFGFQSMSKYYGSDLKSGELNCDKFNLTYYDKSHFLFNNIDLSKIKVNFCFHDYPVDIPNGFQCIAKLDEILAGISNFNLKRYGILFHPEDDKKTWIILDNFINHCYKI